MNLKHALSSVHLSLVSCFSSSLFQSRNLAIGRLMIIVRITIILQLRPPTKQLTPQCVQPCSTPPHHFRFFLQSRCHLSPTDCRQVSEQPTSTATAPRASSPSRTKLTWVSLSYNNTCFSSPSACFGLLQRGSVRPPPSYHTLWPRRPFSALGGRASKNA